MAGIGPITQDWEPVVIRKKAPNAAAKKDEKAVNAARRAGADIETIRKGFIFTFFLNISLCLILASGCFFQISFWCQINGILAMFYFRFLLLGFNF